MEEGELSHLFANKNNKHNRKTETEASKYPIDIFESFVSLSEVFGETECKKLSCI